MLVKIGFQGGGAQPGRVGGEAPVERAQERLAAVAEMFPGVFTVKNERDQAVLGGDQPGDVLQMADQDLCRVFGIVPGRAEPDEI